MLGKARRSHQQRESRTRDDHGLRVLLSSMWKAAIYQRQCER